LLNVTFFGVRSATPVAGAATRRYGGNTACVAFEAPGREPIVCDLGTGLRAWVDTLDPERPSRAHALLTHVHLDHVRGLPLLDDLDAAVTGLDVYGPGPEGRRLADAVGDVLGPSWTPPRPGEGRRQLRFTTVGDEDLVVGDAKVMVRTVPHVGATNGYRVDWEGVSVAYVSDHRAPPGLDTVDQSVLELADGVDLLVHDSQLDAARFQGAEWDQRPGGGHSTVDYAVLVAREAGARCLALFHHDPSHDDEHLDRLLARARRTAERMGVDEVIAAAEGTTVSFEREGP
jgi:phosphoribosyl 1,2-cyclic phosphodiesterase